MKTGLSSPLPWVSLLLAHVAPLAAQTLTQSFDLHPGWNAVYLEAEPPDRTPAVVFTNLPVAGVWTWSGRVSATDFIQNPADRGWNRNQWLAYFAPDSPEALLTNLRAVLPRRAYLVNLAGTNTVTWQVTGRIALRQPGWTPNQYNLRGFPVDPQSPPTFEAFFRHSPAHYDSGRRQLTEIYRLKPDGEWVRVAGSDRMRRGEACWVRCHGASEYVAPFSLRCSTGDSVYYDRLSHRVSLTVENLTGTPLGIRFQTAAGAASPFRVEHPFVIDPAARYTSLHGHERPVPAGSGETLRLVVDRAKIPPAALTAAAGGDHGEVYAADDGAGTLHYLPLGAAVAGADDGAHALSGLWVGTAQVGAVGEAHGTNVAPPTPVLTPFPLRLLVHVDTNGAARLLREVTLLSVPAAYTNAPDTTNGPGLAGLARPAQTVLLSDPALLGQYQTRYRAIAGFAGRRLSAVQFDDALNPAGVPLTGVFGVSNTVGGTFSVPGGHPTNPYFHRYHPDHDNLDETYQQPREEAYAIGRQIELDFTPAGSGVPDYGGNGLDGRYRETITGLHKVPLQVSGSFTLQRISTAGEFNPPLPATP